MLWSHRLASIRGYQRQTILFFIDRSQDKTLKNIGFKRFIEEKFAVKPDSHADFHRWSCENHAKFWESLLTFTGTKLGSSYETVCNLISTSSLTCSFYLFSQIWNVS
ncbi:hypothetical protein KIN20_007742 [Parelaphostrongylus tenuis]|uniref:Uncharacterized protein n=1 Tax=Parelaphostrongylus tenuis TaxID=148309 RepID=A0AAD5QI09_PARTN|nr:hypothetical protein KIN20_007742 [Parelaphostrongylus tenuis]